MSLFKRRGSAGSPGRGLIVAVAYFDWPSAGNFARALQLAATNGLPGGVTLGLVYWRSGRNLVATITLHALIDLVPATRAVHELWQEAV